MWAEPAPREQPAGALSRPDGPYSRDEVIVARQPAACYAIADHAPGVWHFDGASFWLIFDHRQAVCSATFAPEDGWWHKKGCTCALCEARRADAHQIPTVTVA